MKTADDSTLDTVFWHNLCLIWHGAGMSAVMYPGRRAGRRAAADGVLCAAAAGDADGNPPGQRVCMGCLNAADGCAVCMVGLGLDAGLFGGVLAKRVHCRLHKLGVLSLFAV